jgi:hypothetical protein
MMAAAVVMMAVGTPVVAGRMTAIVAVVVAG